MGQAQFMPGVLRGRLGPYDFHNRDRVRVKPGCGWAGVPDGTELVVDWAEAGEVAVESDPVKGPCAATRFELIEDADGWRPWAGGENPVPGAVVEIKTAQADRERTEGAADEFHWGRTNGLSNIVAYRVMVETPGLTFTTAAELPPVDISKVAVGDLGTVAVKIKHLQHSGWASVYVGANDENVTTIPLSALISHEPAPPPVEVDKTALYYGSKVLVVAIDKAGATACFLTEGGALQLTPIEHLTRA